MHTDHRGFTLLELLVALVIVGLALGALIDGVGGSYRAVSVADDYQQALARARSRLALVGFALPLAPVHDSGEDGNGFRWRVDIALAGSATPMRLAASAVHGPPPRMALYAVDVSESWGAADRPHRVSLQTMRIGGLP